MEVTAAVDYDHEIQQPIRGQASGMKRQAPETVYTGTGGTRKQVPPVPATRPSPYAAAALPASRALPKSSSLPQDSGADHLKQEINDLRTMIEGMKNSGYEMSLPAKKRTMVRYLRERSVREEYAYRLCDKTMDM